MKKITCKNCSHGFIPTTDVQPIACPNCGEPAAGVVAMALAAMPELSSDGALPADIQVFPPGKGMKFTLQDYPGQHFEMDVDASVAAMANSDLQGMIARASAGQGSMPFADENHEDAAATFTPARYFWGGEDPKTGGVRLAGEWTPFGAGLVRAKAYRYFSGAFNFSKSRKKFLGLLNENVGGLVNRPGFATQAAFAKAAPSTPTTKEPTIMDATVFKQIVDDALKPINAQITALETKVAGAATPARAAADATATNETLTKIVTDAMKPVTEQLAGMKKTQEDTVKAQAKATVGKYVGRVGLAPQDTDSIDFWEKQVIADPVGAEKQLAKMPARASGTRYTTSGPGAAVVQTSIEPEDVFMAKAKAYGKENKLSETDAIIEFGRSAEGCQLTEDFREKVRTCSSNK